LSILQPAKLARPPAAFCGLAVQARVAPAGVVMASVMLVVAEVTVRPPESWTVTTGWAVKTAPPVAGDGLVVKASLVAVLKMTAVVLTALVSPDADAVRV